MCFLCGNDVSRNSFETLKSHFRQLQNTHSKLQEQWELQLEVIENLTTEICALNNKIDAIQHENENKSDRYIYNLSKVIFEDNAFHYLKWLLLKIRFGNYTLSDLDRMDTDFQENISELKENKRVINVKLERLQQRTWDPGNPIQIGFDITFEYLHQHEVDVFKSLVNGHFSEKVERSDIEGCTFYITFASGRKASIGFHFGSMGDSSYPTITLYVDCYNEEWPENTSYKKQSFIVNSDIERLINKMVFSSSVNKWSNLVS